MKKKNIFIIILAAISLFFLLGIIEKNSDTLNGRRKNVINSVFAAESKDKIIVYYFHTSYRCSNCVKIEQYSSQAVHSGFPEELKDGKIVWKVINVDEEPNKHFVKDYQLYTKSLIIVKIKNGKQAEWKNLNKVWELLYNKNKFISYVQDEIKNYLKGN